MTSTTREDPEVKWVLLFLAGAVGIPDEWATASELAQAWQAGGDDIDAAFRAAAIPWVESLAADFLALLPELLHGQYVAFYCGSPADLGRGCFLALNAQFPLPPPFGLGVEHPPGWPAGGQGERSDLSPPPPPPPADDAMHTRAAPQAGPAPNPRQVRRPGSSAAPGGPAGSFHTPRDALTAEGGQSYSPPSAHRVLRPRNSSQPPCSMSGNLNG